MIGESRTEYQVRDYRVKKGEMADWIEEWRSKIYPVRTKFGFRVIGAWSIRESDRFVWILGWDGPSSFKEAEKAYYDSPERGALTPDPARHLSSIEHYFMDSVVEATVK